MEGCPIQSEKVFKDSPITEEEKWLVQNAFGYIYKITNIVNNKIYIGQRKCVNSTYVSIHNYFGSGVKIKEAIEQEGFCNFQKEYLAYAKSQEELNELEIYYIKEYNARDENIGYNISLGGNYVFQDNVHSEETKKKISEHSLQNWQNPEYREKVIQSRIGHVVSDETKKLMSESAKKSWTEERRQKAIESGNYKRPPLSEEKRNEQRQNKLGNVLIHNTEKAIFVKKEELEQYLKNGWKIGSLKQISKETREKMSESAKKRKPTTLGKRCIKKDNLIRFVDPSELEFYVNQGWTITKKRKY